MKRFFLAIAAIAAAFSAAAATVNLAPGDTVTIGCAMPPTSAPAPSDPRQPTPAPTQPPPGVVTGRLPENNASGIYSGSAGAVSTYELPRCDIAAGCQLEIGSDPETPTEMDVEVGFSRTPGDLSYWRVAQVVSGRGAIALPCGIIAGASQGFSRRWGPNGTFDVCPVNPLERWYVNIRPGPGCGASCKMAIKVNYR